MNYRNRWLLLLATFATLSVFLLAVGRTPGRVYLPVVVKERHIPTTPTATVTPTPTSLPEYLVRLPRRQPLRQWPLLDPTSAA